MNEFSVEHARRYVRLASEIRPAILEGFVLAACDEIDRLGRTVAAAEERALDWERSYRDVRDELETARSEVRRLSRERVADLGGRRNG